MLSVVASSALALNIGTSALTSARAAPSMAAALETKFVYERPAPIGTTTGPEYPNTVRASRLSSANTTVDGRMLETHLSTSWSSALNRPLCTTSAPYTLYTPRSPHKHVFAVHLNSTPEPALRPGAVRAQAGGSRGQGGSHQHEWQVAQVPPAGLPLRQARAPRGVLPAVHAAVDGREPPLVAGVPRALLGGLYMVGNREVVNMVGWFSEATGTFGALVGEC